MKNNFIVSFRNPETDVVYDVPVQFDTRTNGMKAYGREIAQAAYDSLRESVDVEVSLDGIRKEGRKLRHTVSGGYGYNKGNFRESIMATDHEDASFQALWTMAINSEREPDLEDLEMFFDYFNEAYIDEVFDEPVTQRHFNQAFVALLTAVETGDDLEEAKLRAREVLELTLLIEPVPAAGPKL